jgi:hypothetical protein
MPKALRLERVLPAAVDHTAVGLQLTRQQTQQSGFTPALAAHNATDSLGDVKAQVVEQRGLKAKAQAFNAHQRGGSVLMQTCHLNCPDL